MPITRDLLRGSLDLLVLSDIAEAHRYGYQILTSLRERSGGRVDLQAGTIYPILHKLEEDGLVRSWWDDSTGRDRKWYALTDAGRQRLRREARDWVDYATCIRGMIGNAVEPGPAT